MYRLPNCLTSRFVRQPSFCKGIKHSSFSSNIQLFFLPLPHACSDHVTAISSGHVTAISSPPLNWQSKSLISVKPKCHHGFQCIIRKVKKETVNKDRLFFCCAQEDSCNYFEWVPEEPYCSAGLPPPEIKQDGKREEQYPTEDFINNLANLKSYF